MSLSALAEIKGFLTYKKESHIKGVILNRMSPMLYPEVKSRVEEELGIRVFGYVPKLTELNLESRHLGLVLPDEVKELSEKFDHLAEMLEKSSGYRRTDRAGGGDGKIGGCRQKC